MLPETPTHLALGGCFHCRPNPSNTQTHSTPTMGYVGPWPWPWQRKAGGLAWTLPTAVTQTGCLGTGVACVRCPRFLPGFLWGEGWGQGGRGQGSFRLPVPLALVPL